MSEALYRKYRPQVFADVVGQDPIVTTLQNAITQSKVSHAYLFCGPRGTGKTTMARLLSKALLCETGPTPNPDGSCEDCEMIAAGRHPDVYELDAASRTGVENVREEIIGRVQFAPTRGSKKIYIIDEVHMLSTAAFNALLKTLEEPPDHVVFVLCTTDPQKVPETIHSRCQRFDFKRIGLEGMVAKLGAVCVSEDCTFEGEALELIAHRADGGMRNALTSLEQLMTYSNKDITLEAAESMLGGLHTSDVSEFATAVGTRDVPACFAWIARFVEAGGDLSQFAYDFSEYVRDLYVLQIGGESTLDVSEAVRSQMKEHAQWFGTDRLQHDLCILGDVISELKTSTNARLSFEIAAVRMARPASDLTLESLAERIERLEREGAPQRARTTSSEMSKERTYDNAPTSQESQSSSEQPPSATNQPSSEQPSHDSVRARSSAPNLQEVQPVQSANVPQEDQPVQSANVPQASQSLYGRASSTPDKIRREAPKQISSNDDAIARAARQVLTGAKADQTLNMSPSSLPSDGPTTDNERSPYGRAPARQASDVPPEQQSAQTRNPSQPTGSWGQAAENPAALQRTWQQVMAALKRENQPYAVMFMNARAVYVPAKQAVEVQFPPTAEFTFKTANKPAVVESLGQAIAETLGSPAPFELVRVSGEQGTPSNVNGANNGQARYGRATSTPDGKGREAASDVRAARERRTEGLPAQGVESPQSFTRQPAPQQAARQQLPANEYDDRPPIDQYAECQPDWRPAQDEWQPPVQQPRQEPATRPAQQPAPQPASSPAQGGQQPSQQSAPQPADGSTQGEPSDNPDEAWRQNLQNAFGDMSFTEV